MTAEVDTGAVVTSGVEALSIIANKQKTKHFLESRIQADLSADSSGGSSPAPGSPHSAPRGPALDPPHRSRMSAPAPLCPPAVHDDPGSAGAGAAGWRRSAGGAAAPPPETRIAREIREMRCREEELRRQRSVAGPVSPAHDEPLSGYGSDDKDSVAEEPDSAGRDACHPLSRSQESLSSGHSSGLGSDHTADMAGRRRVTVRPYEDQEDGQQWTSFARSAETPIEREIRLSRQREEERRREQALRGAKTASGPGPRPQTSARPSLSRTTQSRRPAPTLTPAPAAGAGAAAGEEQPRQAALRLATDRVQHEIQEATRRELELRGEGHLITTSEETVDDKVTRLGEMAEQTRHLAQHRQQRSEPAPHPSPAPSRPASRPSPVAPPTTPAAPRPAAPPPAPGGPRTAALTTFRPAGSGAGRGLMMKFISSRGKLRTAGAFGPRPVPNAPRAGGPAAPEPPREPTREPARAVGRGAGPAPAAAAPRGPRSAAAPAQRRLQTSWSLDNPAVSSGTQNAERRGPAASGNRRLLTAEEKIQLELKVMKEREDELRRERSWVLARSQPDLLAALEASDGEEEDTTPAPAPLTRTRSNPSLLDDQQQVSGGPANTRRRSVLIDQWESRIQGTET